MGVEFFLAEFNFLANLTGGGFRELLFFGVSNIAGDVSRGVSEAEPNEGPGLPEQELSRLIFTNKTFI